MRASLAYPAAPELGTDCMSENEAPGAEAVMVGADADEGSPTPLSAAAAAGLASAGSTVQRT